MRYTAHVWDLRFQFPQFEATHDARSCCAAIECAFNDSPVVYDHDVIDVLPTGKTFAAFVALTPGVNAATNLGLVTTRDVEGTQFRQYTWADL